MIDWSNPKSKISKYFTVGEATYLPRLKIYYFPTDIEKENIVNLATVLDEVREFLDKPFNVDIWIRPTVVVQGKTIDYNALVKGATNSAHKYGNAVDLQVADMTAQQVRDALKDKLEGWHLRMEDGVAWNHFDNRLVPPGGKRIFIP